MNRSQPRLLEYGRRHRRWSRTCLYLFGVAVLVLVVLAKWGTPAAERIASMRLQRACLSYSRRNDEVAEDLRPSYTLGNSVEPWESFKARFPIPYNPWRGSLVFLHGRRNRAGERLVVVEAHAWLHEPSGFIMFSAYVFEPGSLGSAPRLLSTGRTPIDLPPKFAAPMQLLAGQAADGDPSRFTIRFRSADARGTIEGQLTDDDQVHLRPVDPPSPP